jgi:Carboxypeptidase regulatory-like domain
MRRFIPALVSGFIGLTLTILMVSAGARELASAYEPMAVVNGGAVKGRVHFTGDLPDPVAFKLHRYPDQRYCGALSDGSGYRLLREVLVGPQGGLKDVIVTIEGVKSGKPFELEETKLEANICQLVPYVSVMRKERPLTVKNLDTVAHDLQVYERDWEHIFIMFHRPALTKGGTQDFIRFTGDRRGVIMQCGMHPYMQGHGLAVDNPYYAVTGSEGTFDIGDLPAGTYRIKAWHPTLGEQEREFTVAAGESSSVEFTFKAK